MFRLTLLVWQKDAVGKFIHVVTTHLAQMGQRLDYTTLVDYARRAHKSWLIESVSVPKRNLNYDKEVAELAKAKAKAKAAGKAAPKRQARKMIPVNADEDVISAFLYRNATGFKLTLPCALVDKDRIDEAMEEGSSFADIFDDNELPPIFVDGVRPKGYVDGFTTMTLDKLVTRNGVVSSTKCLAPVDIADDGTQPGDHPQDSP